MRRRDFIKVIAGSAAAWPLATRAEQAERVRDVGVLMPLVPDDPESVARMSAFKQSLQSLGWMDGRNLRIDMRWSKGNAVDTRKYAAELVALAPDVILATGSNTLGPLLQTTRIVPIVFVVVPDPVGGGFVRSLERPGGNATGFTESDYSLAGKWLELLKQVAPGVTHVGVVRDPAIATGIGTFAAIQSMVSQMGVDARSIDLGDVDEIKRAVAAFASSPNGGLIVTGSALTVIHRDLIVALAAQYKLPAVYWARPPVAAGGLISYGDDIVNEYRQAAGYVDRILKGEKPANLPVQNPTKLELVINLKTAKALGLTIPQALLATADEVIE